MKKGFIQHHSQSGKLGTSKFRRGAGFTLIELLIVIGIIAILAAIIFVAVDPARRIQDARDAERWSSVNSILNAILKYTVDGNGTLPTTVNSAVNGSYYVIGTGGSGACDSCADASSPFITNCRDINNGGNDELVGSYLSAIPIDPNKTDGVDTGYYFMKSSSGRITIGACDPERADSIEVSR